MKKVLSLLLVAALLLACASLLLSCGGDADPASAFVSVDINPAIELTVEDGKVSAVYAANEDAQILLYSEEGIVGEKVEDAVAKITELAVEYGYIGEDNAVVNTSVSSVDEKYAEDLLKTVDGAISAEAEKLGEVIDVTNEAAYSVMRKLEQLRSELPDDEAVKNISIAKFNLALSVSEIGEIELEAAVKMTEEELIAKASEHHKATEEFATAAFNEARRVANAAYESALGIATDAIYAEFYLKNILKYPTGAYYGALYQFYKGGARALELIGDAMVTVNKIADYPLSDADAERVVTALGITDRSLIENGSGEVTVRSIEAYADKAFKNSETGAELEAKKEALTEAIIEVESVLREERDEIALQYAEEIAAIRTGMDSVLGTLSALLPADAKTALSDAQTLLLTLENAFGEGGVTVASVRECAKSFSDLSSQYEAKITEQITEDELLEIKEKQKKVEEGLSASRAELDAALDRAETEAKAYLEALKAERLESARASVGG